MWRQPPSCSLEFPSRGRRPNPLSEPAVHFHILIETINFSWANKSKDKWPHVESLLATLHKGGDQSVCMNFLYHWPFASLVSTFKICRRANHFSSVFFFFLNTAAPLWSPPLPAVDVTSMLHNRSLPLHQWLFWHTRSYYRKWVFLQRGSQPESEGHMEQVFTCYQC